MSGEPNPSAHPGVTQEMLLGYIDDSGAVEARYEALRSAAATNIIGALQAEDIEYGRRQGENNWAFLQTVREQLPAASMSARVETKKNDNFNETMQKKIFNVGHIHDVRLGFDVQTNGLPLEALGPQTYLALAALRATTIWQRLPIGDALTCRVAEYTKATFEQTTLAVPHVLAGAHTPTDSSRKTDILLMPLLPATKAGEGSYYANRNSKALLTRHIAKDSLLGGAMHIWGKPYLLRAQLPTSQYTRLLAAQDSLLEDGLTPEEIQATHDVTNGGFRINENVLPLVGIGGNRIIASGRRLFTNPLRVERHAAFDSYGITRIGYQENSIDPKLFVAYSVLEHLQRAAAMLGASAQFHVAKEVLVRTAYADPALKLLES
ncbi:MAG: hypothetical protein JWN38_953 [Candidatus Saccharibacteria bacterium]|nr:hypothetical protein [Candidatus Saccharibacteria bacterium]